MFSLSEIEELCKTVNRNAIKALLRNAAILKDPEATPEQRELAAANVKAISYNKPIPKQPKQKKVKAAATEQATNLVQQQAPRTPAAAAAPIASPSNVKLKYSPVYEHYGVSQDMWNSAHPDTHKELFDHHNKVMSGDPKFAHVKSAIDQAKIKAPKIAKSLDSLYDLFVALKKHI